MQPREPMVLLGERIRTDAAVQEALHRRTLMVVAASQVLGGAGLAVFPDSAAEDTIGGTTQTSKY